MTIQIKNPEVSSNIKTFLSADYTSGTTLSVDGSTSFAINQYILIGEPGLEGTEMTNLTVAPPTSTSLTVSALSFSHPKGTPVYYISYDQFALEYRTSSVGGWVAYGGMPSNLNFDSQYTEYRDSAALSTYGWRYRYYSTEKAAYSDYSDTITASGWDRTAVGYMVREVRKIIGDVDAKTVTDTEIIRFFNKAQDKIYALYDRWWFLLKIGTVIETVASTKGYALPTDFGRMHTVLFNYVNGAADTTYNLKYLPLIEYDYASRDNTSADSDEIKYYTIYPGDSTSPAGYLYIWPTPETANLDITPRYYKKFTDLDSFGDETEVPIPSMLEDYALAEIFKIRKQESAADYYDKLFREQIDLLKLEQRKQVGQPRSLWNYRGRDAQNRLYGDGAFSTDDRKERFF
jgi:hypothetical protein